VTRDDLVDLAAWPGERLGEAVAALASHAGMDARGRSLAAPPAGADLAEGDVLDAWLETAGLALGIDVDPLDASYADLDDVLPCADPCLVRLPGEGAPRFLACVPGRGEDAVLLEPGGARRRVAASRLRSILRRGHDAPWATAADALLERAGIAGASRERARGALLRSRLGRERVEGLWRVRLAAGESFVRQLERQGLLGRAGALVAAHLAQWALLVGSWWVIGQGVLGGRLDVAWLFAWALLLLTSVPFRMAAETAQGLIVIGAGALLKRRLVQGALRLEPEEVRHAGAGQMLGRVMESHVVESQALGGALFGILAIVELAMAAAVVGAAMGALSIVLLAAWVAIGAGLGWRTYRRQRAWTRARVDMTHELVERMVGHRTRVVQERPENWHDGEDASLAEYARSSESLDRAVIASSLLPRGWLVVGFVGLLPAVLSGDATPASIAVSIGGILLVAGALGRLAAGLGSILAAAISWREVSPLFRSATRPRDAGDPAVVLAPSSASPRVAAVDARDVVFRHCDRGAPTLRGCTLRVERGDRVLLEGPSGGGKSTLASIVAGLRAPESGLVLVGGVDRHSLGAVGWRRHVAAAPQFHENHVLSGTMALNALMGRRWPPAPADLVEADEVCRELGLGDLLDRMPSGLGQMVGETGWQLSHGERSRLYVARALLQRSEVVVLDESFAALDPETVRDCIRAVVRRAPTLILIAHP
jgi:ATP-binding cassette, subfamily B, bacterial